jgi:hypothetical protein
VSVDNSALIAPFCPAEKDGDTFIYTEMLDRGKRKGNNGQRLLKTFYHRSVAEFWEQWPTIQKLCDLSGVRACTRLAPRSYTRVGREFTRMVVEASLTDNWAGMKSLYNRACGTVKPNSKMWLWDVDAITEETHRLAADFLTSGHLVARIPSKKGEHLITRPMDLSVWGAVAKQSNTEVHKDNPTNLYIPDGAE